MSKRKTSHKIIIFICTVVIIGSLCGVAYFLYPLIMKNYQKQNIIEIAQGQNLDTIDFEALKAINPDTVGWLQIEGTPINYPVVQTDNNDYYLYNNFEKEPAIEGTVFLDYVCDPMKSRNSILYGHYFSDESMFGSLWRYQEESFLKEHPIIKYDRPNDPGKWEIFSVYITESDYDYRQPDFNDNTEFLNYMNRLKDRSLFNTGVVLSPDDEVITLSTCIYTFDDARFAVHARKIK
ncbi:MAG: class B sortase [Eubacteriaceae bacterium]